LVHDRYFTRSDTIAAPLSILFKDSLGIFSKSYWDTSYYGGYFNKLVSGVWTTLWYDVHDVITVGTQQYHTAYYSAGAYTGVLYENIGGTRGPALGVMAYYPRVSGSGGAVIRMHGHTFCYYAGTFYYINDNTGDLSSPYMFATGSEADEIPSPSGFRAKACFSVDGTLYAVLQHTVSTTAKLYAWTGSTYAAIGAFPADYITQVCITSSTNIVVTGYMFVGPVAFSVYLWNGTSWTNLGTTLDYAEPIIKYKAGYIVRSSSTGVLDYVDPVRASKEVFSKGWDSATYIAGPSTVADEFIVGELVTYSPNTVALRTYKDP
jgi:hypothetical protein